MNNIYINTIWAQMMLKSGIAKENKKIKGLRKNDKSQNH